MRSSYWHAFNLLVPAIIAPLFAWYAELFTFGDIAALYLLGVLVFYFRDFGDRLGSADFGNRSRYEE